MCRFEVLPIYYFIIGKFYVENDTLLPLLQEEEVGKAVVQDEDVNNKMFIVVRNLKKTDNKIVSALIKDRNSFCIRLV